MVNAYISYRLYFLNIKAFVWHLILTLSANRGGDNISAYSTSPDWTFHKYRVAKTLFNISTVHKKTTSGFFVTSKRWKVGSWRRNYIDRRSPSLAIPRAFAPCNLFGGIVMEIISSSFLGIEIHISYGCHDLTIFVKFRKKKTMKGKFVPAPFFLLYYSISFFCSPQPSISLTEHFKRFDESYVAQKHRNISIRSFWGSKTSSVPSGLQQSLVKIARTDSPASCKSSS